MEVVVREGLLAGDSLSRIVCEETGGERELYNLYSYLYSRVRIQSRHQKFSEVWQIIMIVFIGMVSMKMEFMLNVNNDRKI